MPKLYSLVTQPVIDITATPTNNYSLVMQPALLIGATHITASDSLILTPTVEAITELQVEVADSVLVKVLDTTGTSDYEVSAEKTVSDTVSVQTTLTANAMTLDLSNVIFQHLTKIEWLDWDEVLVGDYTADVIDGSINIDSANDVRRTFSMNMNNAEELYIPHGARTNMGVKVRIKRGEKTATGVNWYNRGVFVLYDPSSVHADAQKTVALNGSDKWALHNGDLGGKLEETTVIAIGTNVATAIRAVAADGGETKFAFDTCTVVTPYTITKEPGDTRADLMKELALIPSWDLAYDVDGYLRFCPLLDAVQKQVVADLSVGGEYRSNYVDSQYNPEWSKIKNYWKVIGYSDPDTGITYDGVASLDNPLSPCNTAAPPVGIGRKIEVLSDDNLTTDSLCEQRAVYELRKNLTKIDRSTHNIIPLPFLNEGDCVQLEDTANGIADNKYEIQAINEPLGLGLMQIQVWECVTISEQVAYDDFQTGAGDWVVLGSGDFDVYAFAGDNCLRKVSYGDPNGAYRLLDKSVTDFEFVVYTRRDVAGSGNNQYAITNSVGNGYDISLNYDGTNYLRIGKRTAWVYEVLDFVTYSPGLGDWQTLRLVKVASNLTAEVYDGKVTEFVSPAAYVDTVNTLYTSFTRESILGGYEYFTDEPTVRKLL